MADVCRQGEMHAGAVHALRERGLVRPVRKRLPVGLAGSRRRRDHGALRMRRAAVAQPGPGRPILTAEQTTMLARVIAGIEAGGFSPFLIHGVTGSGKTEVYLAAIEKVVALGREAIVLVPEISLTPQTIERFRRRFARVAVLHSHLSDAERHRHWQSIAAGEVQVVVGVRSAVFRRPGGWD